MAVIGITQHLSIKSLLLGFGTSLAVFALLFIYALINGPQKIAILEESLASKTIIVQKRNTPIKLSDAVSNYAGSTTKPSVTMIEDEVKTSGGIVKQKQTAKPQLKEEPKITGPDKLEQSPIDGLIEETEYGNLPRIHPETGITPFEAYRRPFMANRQDKKLLSFIVGDYGLSKANSERALKNLPKEVTFVLSPYAKEPQEWIDKARAKGHEVWIHIPIQNKSFGQNDPGPAALLLRSSLKRNAEIVRELMASSHGYTGIASYTDEVFVNSPTLMKTTMGQIYKRGLAFLELNARPEDTIKDAALSGGAPYTEIDMVMEQLENEKFKISNLNILAGLAGDKGFAIALLYPSPNIIKQFKEWKDLAEQKGLTLAPASATIGFTYSGISSPVPAPESIEDILYDN